MGRPEVFLSRLAQRVTAPVHAKSPAADALICIPATLLFRAPPTAAGRVAIGGEDCRAEISSGLTGDVSGDMLMNVGATKVIVGHSERRRHHQETSEGGREGKGGVAVRTLHHHLHR